LVDRTIYFAVQVRSIITHFTSPMLVANTSVLDLQDWTRHLQKIPSIKKNSMMHMKPSRRNCSKSVRDMGFSTHCDLMRRDHSAQGIKYLRNPSEVLRVSSSLAVALSQSILGTACTHTRIHTHTYTRTRSHVHVHSSTNTHMYTYTHRHTSLSLTLKTHHTQTRPSSLKHPGEAGA